MKDGPAWRGTPEFTPLIVSGTKEMQARVNDDVTTVATATKKETIAKGAVVPPVEGTGHDADIYYA
jgi:hypothetical protein